MDTSKRQVTIIDELWDNEESHANRRLYDEQERTLQRQNIELNDRVKKFEKQLEIYKHDQPKNHDRELLKRALAKQTSEYNKFLAKKDEEIEQLNNRLKQVSNPDLLQSALRQANIEKLHLEKRLLSSTSSLNSTTTTNTGPTSTNTSASTTEQQLYSSRNNSPSPTPVVPVHDETLKKANEVLKAEVTRLTRANIDNATKLKSQLQQYDELQQAYKSLETNANHLLDIEERYKKEKFIAESCLRENDQLKQNQTELTILNDQLNHKHSEEYNKQKQIIDSLELRKTQLENDLLSTKSLQDRFQDLQITIERLQTEHQLSIKERETTSILNTQLRAEITNAINTNERTTDECNKLRIALIAKSNEYDVKQRENEELKTKNLDLEVMIKTLRDTSDLQRKLNVENEVNKQELKRKQDDFEQFQRMHDVTKREQQDLIRLLQEKIHDLERTTELQSIKHNEILREFESIKTRQDRVLPSSTGTIINQQNLLPSMVHSQPSLTDDSAPIQQRTKNLNEKSAQIVIAKYSYEPSKFSPNDNPEIELPLKRGEYYLIYGDIDEDGFYDGRNLEGRYGLIPSNFIKLVKNPHELPENVKYIIQKLTGKVFPVDERISRHREQTLSNDSDVFTTNNSFTPRKPIESIEPPKRVQAIVSPQSNTLLVSWEHPSLTTATRGYRVLLDGRQLQDITSPLNDRTAINTNTLHNGRFLTMRTLTDNGGESHDSTSIDLDEILRKATLPISQALSTPIISSPLSKSTDRPQLESISSPIKQGDHSDSNRIKTPNNENINKLTSPEERRSIPATPIQNVQLKEQLPLGKNNHLLNKTTNSPRLFIALFDYDPHAMSPNQDNEEELPFKQGEIIKIYGEQDDDGFYIGQTDNGHTGYVPSNMVSEFDSVDKTESKLPTVVPASSLIPPSPKPIKKMVALFDYNPKENSPNQNPDDELSFHSGDKIHVHGNVHNDGFYSGELEDGKKGLVPSNYLSEISPLHIDEKPIPKENETKQLTTTVNKESDSSTPEIVKTSEIPPEKAATTTTTTTTTTTAPAKGSFLDRFKNSFTFNSNEPI